MSVTSDPVSGILHVHMPTSICMYRPRVWTEYILLARCYMICRYTRWERERESERERVREWGRGKEGGSSKVIYCTGT